jgi:hypothetical protein
MTVQETFRTKTLLTLWTVIIMGLFASIANAGDLEFWWSKVSISNEFIETCFSKIKRGTFRLEGSAAMDPTTILNDPGIISKCIVKPNDKGSLTLQVLSFPHNLIFAAKKAGLLDVKIIEKGSAFGQYGMYHGTLSVEPLIDRDLVVATFSNRKLIEGRKLKCADKDCLESVSKLMLIVPDGGRGC